MIPNYLKDDVPQWVKVSSYLKKDKYYDKTNYYI